MPPQEQIIIIGTYNLMCASLNKPKKGFQFSSFHAFFFLIKKVYMIFLLGICHNLYTTSYLWFSFWLHFLFQKYEIPHYFVPTVSCFVAYYYYYWISGCYTRFYESILLIRYFDRIMIRRLINR